MGGNGCCTLFQEVQGAVHFFVLFGWCSHGSGTIDTSACLGRAHHEQMTALSHATLLLVLRPRPSPTSTHIPREPKRRHRVAQEPIVESGVW